MAVNTLAFFLVGRDRLSARLTNRPGQVFHAPMEIARLFARSNAGSSGRPIVRSISKIKGTMWRWNNNDRAKGHLVELGMVGVLSCSGERTKDRAIERVRDQSSDGDRAKGQMFEGGTESVSLFARSNDRSSERAID